MTRAVFSVVVLSALALGACNAPKETSQAEPARPVLVAEVHYAPRAAAQSLPGTVRARIETDLAFRVGGKIAERLVDKGAIVKAGDALARLDDADFRLQLEEAEAERSSARATLIQAEADEQRLSTLHGQGWTASADFDRVKAAADQARAAATRADRAVALAENALNYATLVADADGVVSAVDAEPGQVVAAGAPVLRLALTHSLEASVAVPETLLARAQQGQAQANFWALPGVILKARLREISPDADAATRTFAARFSLDAPPPSVKLGMSLNLTLPAASAPVAELPIAAILRDGEGPRVFVVNPASETIEAASVTLAGADAQSAYVAAGVPDGARVVRLGAQKLQPGEKVRVVEDFAGL